MQPEDIDKLFRDRLESHAPIPPAYLWSQLEEELRPAKKRPVRWMLAAAAVALLLVSGMLWLQLAPTPGTTSNPLVVSPRATRPIAQMVQPIARPGKKSVVATAPQATPPPAFASNTPKADASAALPHQPQEERAKTRRRVGSTAGRTVRPDQAPRVASASETPRLTPVPEIVAAITLNPQPERALFVAEAIPAPRARTATALAATPSVATGPIEVEVLRSNAAGALAEAEGNSHRSLGGILLRQARNAVRGDRVSLAEAGLPETVTVQARVAGRTLTKVIQL